MWTAGEFCENMCIRDSKCASGENLQKHIWTDVASSRPSWNCRSCGEFIQKNGDMDRHGHWDTLMIKWKWTFPLNGEIRSIRFIIQELPCFMGLPGSRESTICCLAFCSQQVSVDLVRWWSREVILPQIFRSVYIIFIAHAQYIHIF